MNHRVDWRIVALHTPIVSRRCPRCNTRQSFICNDKFRINGQGRRLDVWLIYKCKYCEQGWLFTILSRVTPESIPPDLLQAFTDNDEATAWKYAFDHESLRRNDADADIKVETRIDGPEVDLDTLEAKTLEIHIDFDYFTRMRLDALLGSRLPLSRKMLEKLHAAKKLTIEPAFQDDLGKQIKRPVVVMLDVAAARELIKRPAPEAI